MGRTHRILSIRHLVAAALVALATVATVPIGTASAAPPGAVAAADPLEVGPLAVAVAEYSAGPTVVSDPEGITYPAEISGVAHYPAPGEGDGPFPLVIYLHGNHGTCAVFGAEAIGYPCPDAPPVIEPVPNFRGYDYLGQNLASHGYVTVSIDANAVNTYNVTGDRGASERAQLIARTLDHLSGLDDGTAVDTVGEIGDDLLGRVDLDHIGMMGHSRGGEGVTNFLSIHNPTRDPLDGPRYDVDAVLSLAGTDYGMPAAAGAHFATLAPLCDGDVYDLQSIFGNDRHRFDAESDGFARHIWTVAGTNHNFYNSAWLNDDFRGSGRCDLDAADTDRLVRADTERMGITFVNGFMRRYVGGETEFDALLTGAAPLPDASCPGGVGPCDELVGSSFLAPADDRLLVATPGPDAGAADDPLVTNDVGGTVSVTGAATLELCDPQPDGGTDGKTRDAGTASTCVTDPYRSRADAYTLVWDGPARFALGLGVPGGNAGLDTSGYDALTFRTAANFAEPGAPGASDDPNPGDGATDLQVVVTDTSGVSATFTVSERSTALVPQRPDANRELTMNGVIIGLDEILAAGVDPASLRSVVFVAGDITAGQPATGSVQLAEVAFQRFADDGPPPPVVPEGPLPVAVLALGLLGAVVVLRRRPGAVVAT